jgi:hypothetical protein
MRIAPEPRDDLAGKPGLVRREPVGQGQVRRRLVEERAGQAEDPVQSCLLREALLVQDGNAAGGFPPSGGGEGTDRGTAGPKGPVESRIAPRPSRDPNGNPSARLA